MLLSLLPLLPLFQLVIPAKAGIALAFAFDLGAGAGARAIPAFAGMTA